MSNFNIRIAGAANLSQAKAEFAQLRAQVTSLNAAMEESVVLSNRMANPAGYQKMAQAVKANSAVSRAAALSTGAFEVQQLRLNSATEKYTEAIQKQKLTFRDMWRDRVKGGAQISKAAYKEQMALRQMVVKQMPGTVGGKKVMDIYIPNEVHKDFDTLRNKVGFLGQELKAASTQMVNWGKNTQWAGRQMMVGFTMPIAALGAATGVLAYKMDQQITRIQKVYDTTAQAVQSDAHSMMRVEAELGRVRVAALNTARQAAQQYGQSMQDTLSVQAELAATGLKGNKLQSSTMQTMRISTLGELDTTQAINMTIALQTAFKKTAGTAEGLTNAFNFMNATENATSLSIQDIAEALPRAGSAMSALGVSIQEMTVLMTSMKEAGVDAAEGANALKSATGSILKPSPAAAKFIKQISDGAIEVENLADQSGGNLYKALQILFQEMKDSGMDAVKQQQTLVALFGKYQYNRMAGILNNFGGAMNGVQNQTSKAMELMNSDWQSLANTADGEIARIQKSLSGRLKIALESTKVALAEMGKPFLEIGIDVLGAVSKLASAFNGLSDSTKKWIARIAIAAAVFGPLVMLLGLTANFAGNFLKMFVGAMNLATGFKLLNKETAAANLATTLANKGFVTQTTALAELTAQMKLMTEAAQEGALAQKQFMLGAEGAAAGRLGPLSDTATQVGTRGVIGPTINGVERIPSMLTNTQTSGLDFAQGYSGTKERSLDFHQRSYENGGWVRPTSVTTTSRAGHTREDPQVVVPDETPENAKQTAKWLKQSAVAGGLMSAAMVTSMVSSNEMVDNVAQFVAVGSGMVPMVLGLNEALTANADKIFSTIDAAKKSLKSYGGLLKNIAVDGIGGIMQRVRGIGLGLAAGAGDWVSAIKQSIKKKGILADLREQMAGTDPSSLGGRLMQTRYDRIAGGSGGIAEKMRESLSGMQDKWSAIKENAAGAWEKTKGMASALKSGVTSLIGMIGPMGLLAIGAGAIAGAMYLVNKHADDAANRTKEMYEDATGLGKILGFTPNTDMMTTINEKGESVVGQQSKIEAFKKDYADVTAQIRNAKSNQEAFNYAMAQGMKVIHQGGTADQAKQAVELALQAGMGYAKGHAISLMFDTDFNNIKWVVNQAKNQMDQAMKDAKMSADYAANNLGGLNSENAVTSWMGDHHLGWATWTPDESEFKDMKMKMADAGKAIKEAYVTAMDAGQPTVDVLNIAREGLKKINDEITADRNKYGEDDSKTYAAEQKRLSFLMSMTGLSADKITKLLKDGASMTDLWKAAQYEITHETGETGDAVEQVFGGFKKVTGEIGNATAAQRRLNAEVKAAKAVNWVDVYKGAMTQTQDELGNIASANFDSMMGDSMDAYRKQQEARMEGLQARQEAASKAMDARHARQQDALTAKWDKRKDAVDKEIKAEQKAADIRKKLFDAEIQRMQRMAEMANTNIDFNVAVNTGNLDEAAKIRNDMQAKETEWALGDAGNAEDAASQKRLDKLEKEKDRLGKLEDAQKKSLDRRQQAEKDHLAKIQKMRQDATQKEIDNNIAAQQEMWDDRKEKMDKAIQLFKDYVPKNEADLRRHIAAVSKKYGDFNVATKGKFNKTSVQIGDMLQSNVKNATRKIKDDIRWAGVGDKIAKEMIRGAFGMKASEFQDWLVTGQWPAGADITKPDYTKATGKALTGVGTGNKTNGGWFHTGGVVGKDPGGRGGYGYGHKDEVNITALKGEGVLNRKAMSNIGEHGFRALNSGQGIADSARNKGPKGAFGGAGGFSPALGIGGIFGAMMFAAMRSTLGLAIASGAKSAQNAASASGNVTPGKAGRYGDAYLSGEQLHNAAVIAKVGKSLGASQRDIQIALMTALQESTLRNLHYGDRDSVGLFQQRNAWGSFAERTNPAASAKMFFKGGHAGQRGLFDFKDRGSMSMAQAAQAVQVSAYPDAYAKWANEAAAIMKSFKYSAGGGGGASGGYKEGSGGWHKASVPGKGWSNSHDYRNGPGSPLYAASDGVVTDSRAITSGGSGGNGKFTAPNGKGYRSYGETIAIRTASGDVLRYAHLSPRQRYVTAGQHVKGGALIGRSGETGNAWGAHTHFDVNGREIAREWMSSHGIGLKKGAANIKWDNTVANLHKGEAVLTEDINRQFREGVKRFAEGPNSTYNLYMTVNGANVNEDALVNKTMTALKRVELRKPQSRGGN